LIATVTARLDRIASSTRAAGLTRDVVLGPEVVAEEGYVVAVRILDDKTVYDAVEDLTGRMVQVRSGDVLAGTLGSRRALRGYAGIVPPKIEVGDVLHVLNLGGVLGRCTSSNPELGPPFHGEVLGAVLAFPDLGDRVGRPATILDGAIPPSDELAFDAPVVWVAGTCMNSGKTVAATELVRGFSRTGMRVAAAKLTGVALMRDALEMRDAGAVAALTFNDAGIAATRPGTVVPMARGVLNRLAEHRPDVVIVELGDGILGDYGVQDLLGNPGLMGLSAAHVVCASDPVGCWGANELYRRTFGLPITAISGPATDNAVGRDYIADALGVPAHNARSDSEGLVAAVRQAIETRAPTAPIAPGGRGAPA